MENILTEDELGNDNFYHEAPRTVRVAKHCQETVFDKSDFAFGLPKGTVTINPQAKQTKRDRLERLTNEFLESGGAITICPPAAPPKFRFGAFKRPSGSSGASRANDLSRRMWRAQLPDKHEERELIRLYRDGDEVAKQKLVESFHRLVRSIVSQYSGPLHNDLMAAGLFGFCEAISRFNENRGYRLSTYAKHWIRKHVLLAIKDWRKEGAAGETRQDRYIFSNPNATAEQVVESVGCKLTDAERAIARLDAGHEHYDTSESSFDEDGNYTGPTIATSHEMSRMYGCLSRFQLSPQLRIHEEVCGPHRNGCLGWIDEFAAYHIAESQRRLGAPFANRETKKRRVLYLAAENPVDVGMRWIALAQQMDFQADTVEVFFVEGAFKISQMGEKLKAEAADCGGEFGLVIIDTGPVFYEGDDENNRTQQARHAAMLRELIDIIPGKPAVIANVHPVKNAAPDNLLPAGAEASSIRLMAISRPPKLTTRQSCTGRASSVALNLRQCTSCSRR